MKHHHRAPQLQRGPGCFEQPPHTRGELARQAYLRTEQRDRLTPMVVRVGFSICGGVQERITSSAAGRPIYVASPLSFDAAPAAAPILLPAEWSSQTQMPPLGLHYP
eukprot:GHVT01072019.1.p2 GENE.GHVT01072019.1~~GHVT01072019.1.p2  ORF type:complete len:107 (-),score=13.13 GHVT01072019.1:728-1048(-)